MTREEFASILEEAYIEGYNTAIEDIQEDILNEEAYDLEGEYKVYCEKVENKEEVKLFNDLSKAKGIGKETRNLGTKLNVYSRSNSLQQKYPNLKEKLVKKFNKNFLRHPIDTTKLMGVDRIMGGKTPVAAMSDKEKKLVYDFIEKRNNKK